MKNNLLILMIGLFAYTNSYSQATVEAFQSGGSLEIGEEITFVVIYKTLNISTFSWDPTPTEWDINDITVTNGNNTSINIIDDAIAPSNTSPGATLSLTVTDSPVVIRFQTGSADITLIFEAFSLPVELNQFEGVLIEQDAVLSWQTEAEIDNAGFVVERSFNGTDFHSVGSVEGFGNSSTIQNYNFTDPAIIDLAMGTEVYYRLKQVDYNGTFMYSDIVAIELGIEIDDFHIARINGWNSENKQLQVYYHTTKKTRKMEVLIATINGLVIDQFYVYPEQGFNLLDLDMSGHNNGVYVVSINNGKELIAKQIVLQDDY